MNDTVLVAILSIVGTCIGSAAGILTANKLTNYRVSQLEKKVDAHNAVIERTYQLEKRAEVIAEQIKVANHRIEDLEREHMHE